MSCLSCSTIMQLILAQCLRMCIHKNVCNLCIKPVVTYLCTHPTALRTTTNLYRGHFFSTKAGKGAVDIHETHVELRGSTSSPSLHLNNIWLRDHCRCAKCYNHTTKQRIINVMSIPVDIQPKTCSVEDGHLHVAWHDGHESQYPVSWLKHNAYEKYCEAQESKEVLWSGDNALSVGIAHVDRATFLNTESGLKGLLKSLVNYGVGFVENVPSTVSATEQVVQRITHVQRTFFGDMWEFSNSMDHSDTAYGYDALGAHTDHTYMSEASGLQVFHCVHHEGTGGETLLVDGFHAAHRMKQSHPESYQRLCRLAVESEYIEPGRHYCCVAPLLRTHPVTGTLQQVRFNLLDFAPIKTLSDTQISEFYHDLRVFASIIANPCNEWKFKLSPGTVVFVNNWRVLHGRTAYTGLRRMTGCYVGHADWMSTARVLGLL